VSVDGHNNIKLNPVFRGWLLPQCGTDFNKGKL